METSSDPVVAVEQARPFIEDLAERLERTGRAKAIFGEPIERDGATVIPVARACWGVVGVGGAVGGGVGGRGDGDGGVGDDGSGGKRPAAQDQEQGRGGGGGGGGVVACPIGYIEIKDGQTRFHRIADPMTILAASAGAAMVGLALRWLLR